MMSLSAADDAMNTVRAIVALGVAIRVDETGTKLLVKPLERVPDDLRGELCARKWAIITYLESASGWIDSWLSSLQNPAYYHEWRADFDELVAVREFECGNTHAEAERIAFQDFDRRIVPWAESQLSILRGDGDRNTESSGEYRITASAGGAL